MAEIVNLRRVKKARAREVAAEEAAENRARHGMTKGAKAAEAKRRGMAERALDGALVASDSPDLGSCDAPHPGPPHEGEGD